MTPEGLNLESPEPSGSLGTKPFYILSLDGGGAKGFYTLGVLRQVEAMLKCPLHERFNLIFGTSTGAIIASLIALGHSVDSIHDLYKQHVPTVMRPLLPRFKSNALARLARTVFADAKFTELKARLGIVSTRWVTERPMIFKGDIAQAHGQHGTFVPGFGVSIADAVQASCSAYPFFKRKTVTTSQGDSVELVDGGYCANNPTLYAIADAVRALGYPHSSLRVLSVGVGVYPTPKYWLIRRCIQGLPSVRLLQKSLEINTQSMEQLCFVLFKDIQMVRINDAFTHPAMATDLMEHDIRKLNVLRQRGHDSFAPREAALKQLLT